MHPNVILSYVTASTTWARAGSSTPSLDWLDRGLGLIITLGPWPLTNGWFALFSGLSACPVTAWLLEKFANLKFPGWARLPVAILIIMAGRLTLKIEGRGTFLPDFH